MEDDALLPLSALQHLVYCERQCALIHVERVWRENRQTAEGRLLHERTDTGHAESRRDLRILRAVPLRSERLGLAGKADVVELHRAPPGEPGTLALDGVEGRWRLLPIEHKRGKPKHSRCDEVQLCAQALCLEEALGVSVLTGALFYHRPRRRFDVAFDAVLRTETERAATRLHELFASGKTPPAEYEERKCKRCSLIDLCLPKRATASARDYLQRLADGEP